MSNFAIWIGGTWTIPPNEAMPIGIGNPIIDGAPIVRRNSPTARDGRGKPVAVDDELFAIVGRPNIGETGRTWWYTTVGIIEGVSKPVNVRLYDPVYNSWRGYSGTMWMPSYNTGMAGKRVTEFMVHFSGLTRL